MTQRKTIKYMNKESVEKGTEGYITPATLWVIKKQVCHLVQINTSELDPN